MSQLEQLDYTTGLGTQPQGQVDAGKEGHTVQEHQNIAGELVQSTTSGKQLSTIATSATGMVATTAMSTPQHMGLPFSHPQHHHHHHQTGLQVHTHQHHHQHAMFYVPQAQTQIPPLSSAPQQHFIGQQPQKQVLQEQQQQASAPIYGHHVLGLQQQPSSPLAGDDLHQQYFHAEPQENQEGNHVVIANGSRAQPPG